MTWLSSDLFTLGLGLLMLSMGLTLSVDDFRQIAKNPWTILCGFVAQYFVKPLLGFAIAQVRATHFLTLLSSFGLRQSDVILVLQSGLCSKSQLMLPK